MKKKFTLIEILVVVAIIGILASFFPIILQLILSGLGVVDLTPQ